MKSHQTKRRLGVAGVGVAIAIAVVACSSSTSGTAPASSSTSSTSGATPASTVTKGPKLTKSPIVIGNVGTYSGYAGAASKGTEEGLQAWVDWTNAHGGINGHPVQLDVKDDLGVSTNSIADVKDLVLNDHVVAIVGQHESGLESSWASFVDSQKIPVVGGEAAASQWLTDPNFFPTAVTPVNYLTLNANATRLAGNNAYGLVYCAEVPGCALAVPLTKQIAAQLKINFVGGQALSASAPSYTAQCLALKQAGADTIFMAASTEVGLRFLSDCSQQGYNPTPIEPGESWTTSMLTNPALSHAWISGDGDLWFGSSPAIVQFLQAMRAYEPSALLNADATIGWTAGVVFGKAASAGASSGSLTSADIYQGLYSFGPDYTAGGLMPPVTYAKGKPAVQKPCGWYAEVKDGKLTAPEGFGQVCVG